MDVEPPREPDFEPSGHAKRAFADIGDAGITSSTRYSLLRDSGRVRIDSSQIKLIIARLAEDSGPGGPGLIDTRRRHQMPPLYGKQRKQGRRRRRRRRTREAYYYLRSQQSSTAQKAVAV